MSNKVTPVLTRIQMRGLLKLGDAIIPGYGPLPSLSQSIPNGLLEKGTLALDPRSRADLLLLSTLALLTPRPLLALGMEILQFTSQKSLIRLKGFYFTLYFSKEGTHGNSDQDPAKIIGYQPEVD